MKKAVIIGLLVFLLTVAGIMIWSKDKPLSNSVENKTVKQIEEKVNAINEIVVPPDLTQCTQEIINQDCEKVEKITVCGYDHTLYESGKERNNVLQFKSACHYCKFYGLGVKDIAGTKIKGLGYETKPCDQGMYRQK